MGCKYSYFFFPKTTHFDVLGYLDARSCTSFELYDCSGSEDRFIMAGICDRHLMGAFVMSTLCDAHKKPLKDILISSYSSTYLGQVRRTGSLGLVFSVCDDRHNQIALIK
jgi:hypothetical protein